MCRLNTTSQQRNRWGPNGTGVQASVGPKRDSPGLSNFHSFNTRATSGARARFFELLECSTDFHGALNQFLMLKRGKTYNGFNPAALKLEPQNRMKDLKKRDVLRLLGVIGIDERHYAHQFYQQSCGPSAEAGANSQDSPSDVSN